MKNNLHITAEIADKQNVYGEEMRETFKNVSIFIVFICALLLWGATRRHLAPYFEFKGGVAALMCVWSVCVVIIFHLIYYFMGKLKEYSIYLATVAVLLVVGALVYFGKVTVS
jgi:magnesium-transporting ATPase (P-type)